MEGDGVVLYLAQLALRATPRYPFLFTVAAAAGRAWDRRDVQPCSLEQALMMAATPAIDLLIDMGIDARDSCSLHSHRNGAGPDAHSRLGSPRDSGVSPLDPDGDDGPLLSRPALDRLRTTLSTLGLDPDPTPTATSPDDLSLESDVAWVGSLLTLATAGSSSGDAADDDADRYSDDDNESIDSHDTSPYDDTGPAGDHVSIAAIPPESESPDGHHHVGVDGVDGVARRVKRLSVRQQRSLRKIVFMHRCFVKGLVPPSDRKHLWLGPRPSKKKLKKFAAVFKSHLGHRGFKGPGVPRHPWARRYPRSVCGCSSAYAVEGAMATAADFDSHAATGLAAIHHYDVTGAGLLRAVFEVPLVVVHSCSGAGGSAAELHKDGYVNLLSDIRTQPDAVRWFGADHFETADGLDADCLIARLSRDGVVLHATSPECDAYSALGKGSLGVGRSSAALLFGAHCQVAETAFASTGVPTVAETTLGAITFTDPDHTTVARAIWLGAHTEDPHCFQSTPGFRIHADLALSTRGRWLSRHSCVGEFALFPKLDGFGLPTAPCCRRPLCQKCSLHGTQPAPGIPVAAYAEMAGVDPAHPSSFKALVDMLPPRLARYVVAQEVHLVAHHYLGTPAITYDSSIVDPPLLALHDLVRPHLHLLPRVRRVQQLPRLLPPVTTAILILPFDGQLVVDRAGLPPSVVVSPGQWLVESFFAGLDQQYGIPAAQTRVRLTGYLPRPSPDDSSALTLAAIFSTAVITDDLRFYLTGRWADPVRPQHAKLCLGACSTSDPLVNEALSLFDTFGARPAFMAECLTRVALLVESAIHALACHPGDDEGYVPFVGFSSPGPAAAPLVSPPAPAHSTPRDWGPLDVSFEVYACDLSVRSRDVIIPAFHLIHFDSRFPKPAPLLRLIRKGSLQGPLLPPFVPAHHRWVTCRCQRLVPILPLVDPERRLTAPTDWTVPLCTEPDCVREGLRAALGLPLSPLPLHWGPGYVSSSANLALKTALSADAALASRPPPPSDSSLSPATPAGLALDLHLPPAADVLLGFASLTPPTPSYEDPALTRYAEWWINAVADEARVALAAAAGGNSGVPHSIRLLRVNPDGALVLRPPSRTDDQDPIQVGTLLRHAATSSVAIVVELASALGKAEVTAIPFSAASLIRKPALPGDARRCSPLISSGHATRWHEAGSLQPMVERVWALHSLDAIDPTLRYLLCHDLKAHLNDGLGFPAPVDLPWAPPGEAGCPVHPLIPKMNRSQHDALRLLTRPLVATQGPPGAGKSTYIAALVHSCIRPGARVLVTAGSNKAVGSIVEKLERWNVPSILTVGSRERMEPAALRHVLHAAVAADPAYQAYVDRLGLLSAASIELLSSASIELLLPDSPSSSDFAPLDPKLVEQLRSTASALPHAAQEVIDSVVRRLVSSVKVVICTTTCSRDVQSRLAAACRRMGCASAAASCNDLSFDVVVVDEVGAALEPDLLFPLAHGARCLALVGDQAQLPPHVEGPVGNSHYARSTLERLESIHLAYGDDAARLFHYHMLDTQYRTPPAIGDLVSTFSYRGLLQTQYGDERIARPLVVVPVRGEETGGGDVSIANLPEQSALTAAALHLCGPGASAAVHPSRVVAITPYTAQAVGLRTALRTAGLPDIRVTTVDAMQGSEADVILLSTVRSGSRGWGFLHDKRRLNVALSRARELLVIFTHPRSLTELSVGGLIAARADQRPDWPALRRSLCSGTGHGTMEGHHDDDPSPPSSPGAPVWSELIRLATLYQRNPLDSLFTADFTAWQPLSSLLLSPLAALAAASACPSIPPESHPVLVAAHSTLLSSGLPPILALPALQPVVLASSTAPCTTPPTALRCLRCTDVDHRCCSHYATHLSPAELQQSSNGPSATPANQGGDGARSGDGDGDGDGDLGPSLVSHDDARHPSRDASPNHSTLCSGAPDSPAINPDSSEAEPPRIASGVDVHGTADDDAPDDGPDDPDELPQSRRTGLLGGAAGDGFNALWHNVRFKKWTGAVDFGTIIERDVTQAHAFEVRWDSGRVSKTDLHPDLQVDEHGYFPNPDVRPLRGQWAALGHPRLQPMRDESGHPLQCCPACFCSSNHPTCPSCDRPGGLQQPVRTRRSTQRGHPYHRREDASTNIAEPADLLTPSGDAVTAEPNLAPSSTASPSHPAVLATARVQAAPPATVEAWFDLNDEDDELRVRFPAPSGWDPLLWNSRLDHASRLIQRAARRHRALHSAAVSLPTLSSGVELLHGAAVDAAMASLGATVSSLAQGDATAEPSLRAITTAMKSSVADWARQRSARLIEQDQSYANLVRKSLVAEALPDTLITDPCPLDRDHVVDASEERCTPARFTDVRLLTDFHSECGDLSEAVSALIAGDTGGGQSLLGEGLCNVWERKYPKAVITHDDFRGNVRHIKGLNAPIVVLREVSLRLTLAGGVVRCERMPVVSGFYGLVLGNQFNKELQAEYVYSRGDPSATFCYHHDYHGRLSTKMEYLANRVEEHAGPSVFTLAGAVVPVGYSQGDLEIPAASGDEPGHAMVRIMAHNGLKDGDVVLLEGSRDPRFSIDGVIAGVARAEVKDGMVYGPVWNTNPYPVTIGELTPVFRFSTSRIEPELTLDEVMTTANLAPRIKDDPALRERFRKLAEKHLACFRKTLRNSFTHAVKHRIRLKPGYKPQRDQPILRRSPQEEERYRKAAQKILNEATGYLASGEELDFICNALLVPKYDSDGNVVTDDERMVSDNRGVNGQTVMPGWPMPDILRNLFRMRGDRFWSADLFSGFLQVLLEVDSQRHTAVYTPLGIILMLRMIFGLKGAPATFCRMVHHVMEGISDVMTYVDDLVSGAWTDDELFDSFDRALTRLGESGLGVKAKKVFFGFPELASTGFLVNKHGHRPNPERIRPIVNWTLAMLSDSPKKKIPRWLGLANTYNRMTPNFAFFAGVIREAIADGADTRAVLSSLRFQTAFAVLKHYLAKGTSVAVPDYERPFYVMTDCALTGCGSAVLYQIEEQSGTPTPIWFWSERIQSKVTASSRDYECHTAHQACCRKFISILQYASSDITLYCDCKALESMMTTRFTGNQEAHQMAVEMSALPLVIVWRPGHQMIVPDSMTRADVRAAAAQTMFNVVSLVTAESLIPSPSPSLQSSTTLHTATAVVPPLSVLATFAVNDIPPSCLTLEGLPAAGSPPVDPPDDDDDISCSTLVLEAESFRDTRGSGVPVFVTHLGDSPPLSGCAPLYPPPPPPLPPPTTLVSSKATRPYRPEPRAATALIHPTAGVLVLKGSCDPPTFSFPGGPLSRPGSYFKAEVAGTLHSVFSGAADPLVAFVRRRRPCLRASFEPTTYLVYVVDEREAACCLLNLATDSTLAAVLTFRALAQSVFTLNSDVRLAGLLRERNRADDRCPVHHSCLAAAASALLSAPPPLERALLESRGPTYITTSDALARWSTIAQAELDALAQRNLLPVIAVDLEGDLRSDGRAELIQLHVRSCNAADTPCIAVIDLRLLPSAIDSDSTVRSWLQDPSILKQFHNCHGDAGCLHGLYDISLRGVVDTAVADSILRGVKHGTTRSLTVVTSEYVNHSLTESKALVAEHEPTTWTVRPLAAELFYYAYMDVRHGVELLLEMKARCEAQGTWPLVLELSADRCPPRSLPFDKGGDPPSLLVPVVHNDVSMVTLQSSESTQPLLLTTEWDASLCNRTKAREAAQALWVSTMGAPPKGLMLLYKFGRAQRVGPLFIIDALLPLHDEVRLAALRRAFASGSAHDQGLSLAVTPLSDCADSPYHLRLLSAWLLHARRVHDAKKPAEPQLSAMPKPPAELAASPPADHCDATLVTRGDRLIVAAIHDESHIVLLRHKKQGLTLPAVAPLADESPGTTALRAIETLFGRVFGLGTPLFERTFRDAIRNGTLLFCEDQPHLEVFSIRLDSLLQWYSSLHTAFYFRRSTPTMADTLYAYCILSFDTALHESQPKSTAATSIAALVAAQPPLIPSGFTLCTEQTDGLACFQLSPDQPAVARALTDLATTRTSDPGPGDPRLLADALFTWDGDDCSFVLLSGDAVWPACIRLCCASTTAYLSLSDSRSCRPSYSCEGDPSISVEWDLQRSMWRASFRGDSLLIYPPDPLDASMPFGSATSPSGFLSLSPCTISSALHQSPLGATCKSGGETHSISAIRTYVTASSDATATSNSPATRSPPTSALSTAGQTLVSLGSYDLTGGGSATGPSYIDLTADDPTPTPAQPRQPHYPRDITDTSMCIYYDAQAPPGLQRGLMLRPDTLQPDDCRDYDYDGHSLLRSICGGVVQSAHKHITGRQKMYTIDMPGTGHVLCGNPSYTSWAAANEDTEYPANHQLQMLDIYVKHGSNPDDQQSERDDRAKRRRVSLPAASSSDPVRRSTRPAPPPAELASCPTRTTQSYGHDLSFSILLLVQVDHADKVTVHYGATGPMGYKRDYGTPLPPARGRGRRVAPITEGDVWAFLERQGLHGDTAVDELLLRGAPLDDETSIVINRLRRQRHVGGHVDVTDVQPGISMKTPLPLMIINEDPTLRDSTALSLPTAVSDDASVNGPEAPAQASSRKGRAAYVEELPPVTSGDRTPPTNSPSMTRPVQQPAHPDALPAAGDPISDDLLITRNQLITLQRADPLIKEILAVKLVPSLLSNASTAVRWHDKRCRLDDDGVLYETTQPQARVFLPTALLPAVCTIYHDMAGAHHGYQPTLREVSNRFYNPSLRKFIRNYVFQCGPCSKGKRHTHRSGTAFAMWRGDHPWDVVTMDVYHVGHTVDGYDHILIMVCNLTNWIRVAALKGSGTERELLAIFEHEVIRNEGTPRVIRSDRGSNLIGKVWSLFCTAYRITDDVGAAYRHSTAALAERFLGALGVAIRVHKIATKDQNWPDYIHKLEVAFNFKYGGPFYLNRGRDPNFPYDLALYGVTALRARGLDGEEWLRAAISQWHSSWDARNQELFLNGVKDVARRTAKQDTAIQYKVNDPVLLERPIKHGKSQDGKWSNIYYDEPLRVQEVLPHDEYILMDFHNQRMRAPVHVSRTKPYPPVTNDGEVAPEPGERFVEKIVGRHLVELDDGRRALEYRVRWRGLPPEEDEWFLAEEVPNLAELIRVYDNVIKPLPVDDREALYGYRARIENGQQDAPTPHRRNPETYGPRHFRYRPASTSQADPADDAVHGTVPVADDSSAGDADPTATDDLSTAEPPVNVVDDDCVESQPSPPPDPAADDTLEPISLADFKDDDGIGISDLRYDLNHGQQFLVGRRDHHGYVRTRWITTANLTDDERTLARRFRAARDAGRI